MSNRRTDIPQEGREDFERYAAQLGLKDFETNEFDSYRNPHTQGPWNFWRASRDAQRAALAAPPAEGGRKPDGYAYEYAAPLGGGTVIRYNHGQEVNGLKPQRAIPLYFDRPPAEGVVAKPCAFCGAPVSPNARCNTCDRVAPAADPVFNQQPDGGYPACDSCACPKGMCAQNVQYHGAAHPPAAQAGALDAARLDWLQANHATPWMVHHQEIRPTTEAFRSYEKVNVFDGWAVGVDTDPKPTIREAIDAAMASQPNSSGSKT